MASHQTIVVELGSSRIKVGFAGESKPRRVFNGSAGSVDGVNDSFVSRACNWTSCFRYFSSPSSAVADGSPTITTVHEWEKSLYPLFSHMLTSVLFIQRPSRHRMLLLINDAFPPHHFQEALHRVLLDYLGLGGVWLANGGVFEGIYHLMEGLPPSLPSAGRPKAHLLVDIGTHEARIVVSVTGSSILEDTYQSTMSGYKSFLRQVLTNYQEMNENVDESEQSENVESQSPVVTLEDANAVAQAWVGLSSSTSDAAICGSKTISVNLPSLEHQQQTSAETATTEIPIQPLLEAFHQVYLDYTDPSSLIYAVLSCVVSCPIDYRKVVLQNVMLLGGGSVTLRHFGSTSAIESKDSTNGLAPQLEMAASDACGITRYSNMEKGKEEEKKEDMSSISRYHFQSLRGAVAGTANDKGERIGGVSIQYPDPFAADLAAWMGGSIMGKLDYKDNYRKKL